MSVAEIIAAARRMDGGEQAAEAPEAAEEASAPGEPVAASEAAAPSEPAAESEAASASGSSSQSSAPQESAAASKPVPKSGPGRPSVAEMMAMARGEKKQAATEKSATEKPAAKPSAKPAAKSASQPAAKKPAAKANGEKGGQGAASPRNTASILAAARKPTKPGPMSKSEAAAKGKVPEEKPEKKPEPKIPVRPPKPDYAKPKLSQAKAAPGRRQAMFSFALGSSLALGFTSLAATLGMWTLGFARFMFPNVLREPPSRFKVGFPGDFPPGLVETKFKAQFGVWVVNSIYKGQPQIYALQSVCTHLGCTPNWLEAEQKFKCPCHGSGFYKDGINFEGPAPRPLERYAIQLADDGQLEIDKSQTFQEEMGEWGDPSSFVAV